MLPLHCSSEFLFVQWAWDTKSLRKEEFQRLSYTFSTFYWACVWHQACSAARRVRCIPEGVAFCTASTLEPPCLEQGTPAIEGSGTSLTWYEDDPKRLEELYTGAVQRLHVRFAEQPIVGTDSHDGSSTELLRAAAVRKKVLAGFQAWKSYTSYEADFE